MTALGRVGALQALLARVQRNATRPREVVAAPAAAPDRTSPGVAAKSAVSLLLATDDEVRDLDQLSTPPPPPPQPGEPRFDQEETEVAATSGVISIDEELDTDDFDTDDFDTDGELELESGELIDVTDLSPEEVASIEAEVAGTADDLLDEEATAPSSARRPKPPATMDEAIASAAERRADEAAREVPLHTPPPESGRQVTAPLHVPPQAEPPDDLLEVGAELPRRPPSPGPTTEQLGETIDLDEPLGGDLELDQASDAPTPMPPRPDELEHELPHGSPGAYDAALELPSTARADLERHEATEASLSPPPVSLATPPVGPRGPVVVQRPALHARPAELVGSLPRAEPRSFLDLLDGSLAL